MNKYKVTERNRGKRREGNKDATWIEKQKNVLKELF
jgi:hypothetical protein